MGAGNWIKYIVKNIAPRLMLEAYWGRNRRIVRRGRFSDDMLRMPAKNLYEKQQPPENSRLSYLEGCYDKVIVCWLPVWIIGHFCTVYHYVYQMELKETSERVCCLIVPNTLKSAVGQGVPNQYLYTKFTEQMPSAIDPRTAWPEYIKKHSQRVLILDTEDTDIFYLDAAKAYFQGSWGELSNPFDQPSVSFSQEEEAAGRQAMRELGVEKKYICIFARDAAYHGETTAGINSVRNFDINSFQETAEFFFEQHDMQSVRMGAKVNKGILCEGVIDYASLGRTEFLDAFLFSRCEFYVGNSSGIDCIARLFSKPLVAVDFPCVLPIDEPTMPYHLLIYLKWYDEKKQRYLTLRELVRLQVDLKMKAPDEHGLDAFFNYVSDNLAIVHNTSQEILEVAEEMYAILHGTMEYTDNDDAMQKKYRDIIHEGTKNFKNITGNFGRVGAAWLRENAWFLE